MGAWDSVFESTLLESVCANQQRVSTLVQHQFEKSPHICFNL